MKNGYVTFVNNNPIYLKLCNDFFFIYIAYISARRGALASPGCRNFILFFNLFFNVFQEWGPSGTQLHEIIYLFIYLFINVCKAWGPSGTQLHEISMATTDPGQRQLIFQVCCLGKGKKFVECRLD